MAYVKSIKNDLVQVGAKPEDLTQVAWNFINDSLRTTIALHVHSRPSPRHATPYPPAYHLASHPAARPAACYRQLHPRPTVPCLRYSLRRNVWRRQRSTWRHDSWASRFLLGTR